MFINMITIITMSKIQDIIFWTKNSFRPEAMRQYRKALAFEQWGGGKIEEENWQMRKEIVRIAYERVPFYKKFYNERGFNPSMLTTPETWELVPILEKRFVRDNLEEMKDPSAKPKFISYTQTGGSTGTPMRVYTDRRHLVEVQTWRAFGHWGISPADNEGIIHRRVPTTFVSKMKNRLLWWPTKRAYLNASSMSWEDVAKFVNDLKHKNIVWIQGYVGGLEMVADYMIKHNLKVDTLRMVWSTSAPLHDSVRMKMERAFGCKIMNQYGCNEMGNIAMQCPHCEDLHIEYDMAHIDIVDTKGHLLMDEEGDILLTHLRNRVAPLIKYRLGDRGVRLSRQCACGNPMPLMSPVKGRISDAVYTPSGVLITGEYLTAIFDKYALLFSQYQVKQWDDYSITVYVKAYKNDEITQAALKCIQSQLNKDTRGEMPVNIELTDYIKSNKGKIQYIISEVALKKYEVEK